MGFLRRKREEPTAVPDWAAFFTPDEYKAFLEVVMAELGKGGAQYTLGDGFVRVAGSDGELGLSNLAQVAHVTERNEWPQLVFESHFANLRASTGRPSTPSVATSRAVGSMLRVRLLADESMGGVSLGDMVDRAPLRRGS